MSSSLKYQVLHGAFWSFVERFGLLFVQFIVSIILARVLSPEEFGLVAMITVFTLFALVIVESGFGQAIIQKQNCTHTDESTAFWFNVIAGVAMTLALFGAAPYIASFYGKPELVLITRVTSFNMLINSFGVLQNALMQKELQFKKRTIAYMAGVLFSGTCGIVMALKGFGVWSLVVQGLLNNLLRTLILWIIHPWRPLLKFSSSSFRNLFRFGSNMMISGIINTVFNNIYLLIIGKVYGSQPLGYYHKAKEFLVAGSHSVAGVVSQVNFPVLSKLQHDPEQMRDVFRKVLKGTMIIVIPVMTGLIVSAPNLVPVVLGSKWLPSVPYVQLIGIIGLLYPLHVLNLDLVRAVGRSDLFLKLGLIKRSLTVISIVLSYRFGVTVLLWAQCVTSFCCLLINSYFTRKIIGLGLMDQFRDICNVFWAVLPILCSSAVLLSDWSIYVQLLVQLTVGIVGYLMMILRYEPEFAKEAFNAFGKG